MKWSIWLLCALFLFGSAFPQDKTEQVTEQKPVTAEEKAAPAPEGAPPLDSAAPAAAEAAPAAAPSAQPTAAPTAPAQEADITPLMKTVKLNFKEGNYGAADKAVDMALALRPNDFDAVKYKAMIALKTDKLDVAEQNFKLALTAAGNDAELDFYLGGFYGKKGDFLAAEKCFLKYSDYGILEPYRERLRKYAGYIRPKADRARARQLLQQEATFGAWTPPQNSVAVVSFANTGAKKELDPLQKGLAEMLITDLSQVGRFKVIERVQMHDADKLVPAEWGDSDNVEPGALVWAVGSPFGLSHTITSGILSAKHRSGLVGTAQQDFLQTDAAVNPGNSGGPLVDATGKVIGINTAIVGEYYQGISFAIPSSLARDIYDRLKTEKIVRRGWLGVELEEMTAQHALEAGLLSPQGVYIANLYLNNNSSPAAAAGIQQGDVLLSWNGVAVNSALELRRQVENTKIGSRAKVILLRGGQEVSVDVVVGQRPPELT